MSYFSSVNTSVIDASDTILNIGKLNMNIPDNYNK